MIDLHVPTMQVAYRLLKYALRELNDGEIEEAKGTLMEAIRMMENVENMEEE